jgi:hypothetical protein
MGRKPFDDRDVREILATIPRVATFHLRERAILTLQVSAPMRPDEVRRIRYQGIGWPTAGSTQEQLTGAGVRSRMFLRPLTTLLPTVWRT